MFVFLNKKIGLYHNIIWFVKLKKIVVHKKILDFMAHVLE